MRNKRELTPLGQQIKIACVQRKISIQDAACILGIPHKNYLSRIMYGEVGVGKKYEKKIQNFLRGKVG